MFYVSDHIHVFNTMQYYAAVRKYIHVLFVCIFILNMMSIKQCGVVHISSIAMLYANCILPW